MDYSIIVQLIGSVGFPIVCCLFMAWYIKDITDKHRDEVSRLNEQHRDEISRLNEQHKQENTQMTEALNNNTLALQKLCERLGAKDEH